MDTTPRARNPRLTQLIEEGPRIWTARHTLLGATEEADDWMLEATVDLREKLDPDEPLLELRRVGT